VVFFYKNKKPKLCATNLSYIQCDQQENEVRVLPHILFYRNVSLILIVHIVCTYMYLLYTRIIGCLPLEKSITSVINY
jgi:hypothetical protein